MVTHKRRKPYSTTLTLETIKEEKFMSRQTSITTAQIELVKETWAKVAPIADTAAKQFYDRLFETNPQISPMFDGTNLPEQRRKLVKAINMAVISLERFETKVPVIRNLGYNHVFYGVKEWHYGQVGATLLWTLEAGLGDEWSNEAAMAWAIAYQMIADVMIKGARQHARSAA
jgi:hemoglobin-like flavoprotein